MVRVHIETPSCALINPEALIRQVIVAGVNRAVPEMVVSRFGVSVNVTFPEVTTAFDKSLIVPVIVVVVCAQTHEHIRTNNRISFFIWELCSSPELERGHTSDRHSAACRRAW